MILREMLHVSQLFYFFIFIFIFIIVTYYIVLCIMYDTWKVPFTVISSLGEERRELNMKA